MREREIGEADEREGKREKFLRENEGQMGERETNLVIVDH